MTALDGLDPVPPTVDALIPGGDEFNRVPETGKSLRDLAPRRDKSITQLLQIFLSAAFVRGAGLPLSTTSQGGGGGGGLCSIWPLWGPLQRSEPAVKMPTFAPESRRSLDTFLLLEPFSP